MTPVAKMTYAEYLAFEQNAETKHEYVNGEVLAMAGGTIEHAALAAAMIRTLGNLLDGKPCRVMSSEARVRVVATRSTFYPDVTVVCGKLETAPDDANAIANPIVLIEVLSESTEGYDRGEKAAHYRRIPSLRELVFVNQRTQLTEVMRRNERNNWELFVEAGAGEIAELTSVGAAIEVDAIYRDPLAQ